MQNEDFYHRIKARLSNIEPAYDPADWAAMETLLDRKKRILPIWALHAAASLAILAIGFAGYYYLSKMQSAHDPIARVEINHKGEKGSGHSIIPAGAEEKRTDLTIRDHHSSDLKRVKLAQNEGNEVQEESKKPAILNSSTQKPAVSAFDYRPEALVQKPSQAIQKMPEISATKSGTTIYHENNAEPLQRRAWKPMKKRFENMPAIAFIAVPSAEPGDHNKRWHLGLSSRPAVQFLESSNISLSNGVLGGIEINDRIAIEGGIFKEKMAYRAQPSEQFYINENHRESQAKFNGISLPMRGSYRIAKGRIAPFISAGLTAFIPQTGYYVFTFTSNNASSNLSATIENDTVKMASNGKLESVQGTANFDASNSSFIDQSKRKNLYLLVSGGAGVQYQLNSQLSLQLAANYYQPLDGLGVEKRKVKKADLEFSVHYFIN